MRLVVADTAAAQLFGADRLHRIAAEAVRKGVRA
jgi:hypothetical protein